MADPQKPKRTAGRKSENERTHISWPEDLLDAANAIGKKLFGSRSAYLAHLFVKELERQNLTVIDVIRLAEEWRASGGRTAPTDTQK